MLNRFLELHREYVIRAETPTGELTQVTIEGLEGYFRSHPEPAERLAQITEVIAHDHLTIRRSRDLSSFLTKPTCSLPIFRKLSSKKVQQVVRLIRSKGVGVYFVTQNPLDVPEEVLGQLGNPVQHALRASTPKEQKSVRGAAETFRSNPKLDVEKTITELAVGEARLSFNLVGCLRREFASGGFSLPLCGAASRIKQYVVKV